MEECLTTSNKGTGTIKEGFEALFRFFDRLVGDLVGLAIVEVEGLGFSVVEGTSAATAEDG